MAGVRLPQPGPGVSGNWLNFTILVDRPARLKETLWRRHGIDTTLPSIDPCHEMPYFEEFTAALPCASQAWREALYLPAQPTLRDDEVRRVAAAVIHAAGASA